MKIFLVSLLLSSVAYSQIILVPEKTVPLETYLTQCHREGYQCTQDYFKSQIKNTESLDFENFLESIDLYNEDYRQNLFSELKKLLSKQDISLEQGDLLVNIINKSLSLQKNGSLVEMKNEIIEISNYLKNSDEEKSDTETFIIFKKALSKKQFSQIKYKIKYTKITKITPYTEPTAPENLNPKYLLEGNCDTNRQSSLITEHVTPFFNQECGSVFTSVAEIKWDDYKKPIIYTALAAAAVFFLSQYEVQVQY